MLSATTIQTPLPAVRMISAPRVARAITGRLRSLRDAYQWHKLRSAAPHAARHQPGTVRLNGYKMSYTDLRSVYIEYKDIFVNRIYHFDTDHPRPRILDGGACVGMSVLYFKSVYAGARITCFEPDSHIRQILKRNLNQNNLNDVQIVPAGLAAGTGHQSFAPDGVDGGKIIADQRGGPQVNTVQLSRYLDEPVDFLKLNIEGQELPVLEEAGDRLRQVDQLVIEYHGWAQGSQCLGRVLNVLDSHGFRYLVHDFDAVTCATSKPPFRIRPATNWFCLIYARRLGVST